MDHPTEPVISVMLVDDHAILRDGLREILESQDGIDVVGEAGTADQAVATAAETRPDVITLDVDIPGSNVTETMSRLQRVSPQSRVLILSVYDDPPVVRELLGLGIRGYLLKSVTKQDLVSAIRGVYHDENRIVLSISRESSRLVHSAATPELLSTREREIMGLVAVAMSNAQIASKLYITEGTVKRHLRNIFTKLGAVSRIDAVNKATQTQQLPTRHR